MQTSFSSLSSAEKESRLNQFLNLYQFLTASHLTTIKNCKAWFKNVLVSHQLKRKAHAFINTFSSTFLKGLFKSQQYPEQKESSFLQDVHPLLHSVP